MDLKALYRLQSMQLKLDELKLQLKSINEGNDLSRLKEEFLRLKDELSKGEEKLKRNGMQQKIKNNEIESIIYNKKACEEIKFSRETDTIKKMENMDKQIKKLDDKKREAESDIIKLVEEAENIKEHLKGTKKKLNFIKKKYINLKENMERQLKEISSSVEELSSAIDEAMKAIDKKSLEIYGKARKQHKDPVAAVENFRCLGCGVEVPAMDYDALKRGSTEHKCQNCGRMLFRMTGA